MFKICGAGRPHLPGGRAATACANTESFGRTSPQVLSRRGACRWCGRGGGRGGGWVGVGNGGLGVFRLGNGRGGVLRALQHELRQHTLN